ncbi:MAG: ABC transporter permease [Thermostichus sp. DG02_5_bins_236]
MRGLSPRLVNFALRSALKLLALLLAVAVVSFVLIEHSPIDPVSAYIGADMLLIGPEQRQLIAERWGLDQPATTRFWRWLWQLAQGNLGTSSIFNQPVAQVIASRFATSFNLMFLAWVLSGLFGVGLGILAGAKPGSWPDRVIRLYAYTLASSPTFWVGLLLLILFSVQLGWAPFCCSQPPGIPTEAVTVWQRLHHLILPALTLSLIGVASIALHTRQKLVEILESDFVLFARAQGESTLGIIWHHGLRNIALPALTLQLASLSELFGGSVLAEQVFAYPGLGQATVQAALRSDVPLLLGIVLFSTVFVVVGNTLADLAYQVVDPRVRIGK